MMSAGFLLLPQMPKQTQSCFLAGERLPFFQKRKSKLRVVRMEERDGAIFAVRKTREKQADIRNGANLLFFAGKNKKKIKLARKPAKDFTEKVWYDKIVEYLGKNRVSNL